MRSIQIACSYRISTAKIFLPMIELFIYAKPFILALCLGLIRLIRCTIWWTILMISSLLYHLERRIKAVQLHTIREKDMTSQPNSLKPIQKSNSYQFEG